LRLGLRRFVEPGAVVLRLLVLDATGQASVSEVGRIELDEGEPPAATAVAPQPQFLTSTAEAGLIFEDTVDLGKKRVAVRVERLKAALIAEARTGKDPAPWQTAVTLPLPEGARVRAAALARGRYLGQREMQPLPSSAQVTTDATR
jgi:hypothetical protein